MRLARSLLWIDSRAGLAVGASMLALFPWLTELYGLPRVLLISTGIANVTYGTYSFVLERRAERPHNLLMLLVVANFMWSVLCFGMVFLFATSAQLLGTAVLMFEGAFVGVLAMLEWRSLEALRMRA